MLALSSAFSLAAGPTTTSSGSTCYDIKAAYQGSQCCGTDLQKVTDYNLASPPPPTMIKSANPCEGAKPYHADASKKDYYFKNTNCTLMDGARDALEQAGANITMGYKGQLDTGDRKPIMSTLFEAGLCPVNVHWHLGTEHYSAGEFDEFGSGPARSGPSYTDEMKGGTERRLAADTPVRGGFHCRHYNKLDPKFNLPYKWKHCTNMVVGETYEVHWPHSAAGSCQTSYQYQTPFYDGVFCRGGIISLAPLNTFQKIGVHGQVFTIVNDENYYYPDLIKGMVVDGEMGQDVAKYTGSTTGTTRNNEVCSRYTPITWHVDRKCHMISASSFDKMCADMKEQADDMSGDLHPHGSRELVDDHMAANNLVRRD